MMKTIFFADVDTQRDLMSTKGSLYVPGSERIISKLKRLFEFADRHEIFVLSSVNANGADDVRHQGTPAHCLSGTLGQRKLDETLFPRPLVLQNRPHDRNLLEAIQKYRQIILEKQEYDPFSNPVTERLLRALPQRAIVFGVPLELSVRLMCLGLRKRGIKTAVLTDVVLPLAPAAASKTTEELRKAGVDLITMDILLGIQNI